MIREKNNQTFIDPHEIAGLKLMRHFFKNELMPDMFGQISVMMVRPGRSDQVGVLFVITVLWKLLVRS